MIYYSDWFGDKECTITKKYDGRTQINIEILYGELFDKYDTILEKLYIYKSLEFSDIYDGILELSSIILDEVYLCPDGRDERGYKASHIKYILRDNAEYDIFEFLGNLMIEYCSLKNDGNGSFDMYLDDIILESEVFRKMSYLFNTHKISYYGPSDEIAYIPINGDLFDYILDSYISYISHSENILGTDYDNKWRHLYNYMYFYEKSTDENFYLFDSHTKKRVEDSIAVINAKDFPDDQLERTYMDEISYSW